MYLKRDNYPLRTFKDIVFTFNIFFSSLWKHTADCDNSGDEQGASEDRRQGIGTFQVYKTTRTAQTWHPYGVQGRSNQSRWYHRQHFSKSSTNASTSGKVETAHSP